jgi:hypothetical protein
LQSRLTLKVVSWALLSPFQMTWHVCGANPGGNHELESSLGYRPIPDGCDPLNRAEPYGQRLLFQVQEGDRWIPEAAPLAVSHLQEDLVREMPEEEGRACIQEACLSRLPYPDAGGRPREHQKFDADVMKAIAPLLLDEPPVALGAILS